MSEKNQENINVPFYKKAVFWFIFLYFSFIAIYTIIFICKENENIVLLTSNELGDFLAGSFAPLAFLFLYLGYKQQGEELKQNTKALNLQAEELKNSVEQQKELVKIQQQELESKHFSVLPYLVFSNPSLEQNISRSTIYNEHCEAIDVNDEINYGLIISFKIFSNSNDAFRVEVINTHNNFVEEQFAKITQGDYKIVNISLFEDDVSALLSNEELDLIIHVKYFDSYGKPFMKRLKFNIYQFDWSLKYANIQIRVLNN